MSSNFWQFVWLILIAFFFLAYLSVMFRIVVDLFRDEALGGLAKALWIIGLFVLPLLAALVYIVARGRGMAERQHAEERHYREAQEDYIREVAGSSPTDQIARAKHLLQDGTITEAEFAQLKARALGGASGTAAGAAA